MEPQNGSRSESAEIDGHVDFACYCRCPKFLHYFIPPFGANYTPQSGNVGTEEMRSTTRVDQTITSFSEQNPGYTISVAGGNDDTMDIVSKGPSDISSFLSRPVRISTQSWAVGSPLFAKINPWTLWATDTYVRQKLAHYNLLRCRLHVKAVVSGTGFHYGRALLGYNPWSITDDVTTIRNFLEVDMVQLSQRPKVFINPTTNEGGELICPFFYNHNYMNLRAGDYADMGELYLKSFQDLAHANGGDDPVTITIFAWAEDVTLTMPTSQYTAQSGKRGAMNSGDEYGKGIISSTASAIADAAGTLTDAPVIGPYARATEICARAGADVARMYGYSRPPIISEQTLMKPLNVGNLANIDASDAVSRLTLDSKQEITIDSRTVGLDGKDQMSLSSIVTRESYLTQFTWSPSQTLNTMLWNSRVGPHLYRVYNGEEIHPTPMSMVSSLFERWQGTIKFRFQIVKSAFHKGKLLVRWDPNRHNPAIAYNTVYSRVVDIAEEDDFEVEIGWGQAEPFLKTKPMTNSPGTDFDAVTQLPLSNAEIWNGILEVDVLNALVSPGADASISVNVFVSMSDDFKFGGPTNVAINNLSVFKPPVEYTPQSGSIADMPQIASDSVNESTDKPEETVAIAPIASMSTAHDKQYQVFYGECPTSLRELFRRYIKTRSYYLENSSAIENIRMHNITVPGFPFHYGLDPNGIDTYATNTCTMAVQSPLSYMAPCYAGWRGSFRKKFVIDGAWPWNNVTAQRVGFLPYSANYTDLATPTTQTATNLFTRQYAEEGFNGLTATDRTVNSVLETEIPYYIGKRMSPSREPGLPFNNGSEAVMVQVLTPGERTTVPVSFKSGIMHQYDAVGEDFSLFFFVGCPILYNYDLTGI